MVITQWRSRRKPTGARYKRPYRSKRRFESGNLPMETTVGSKKVIEFRIYGGGEKKRLLRADTVNVYDPKKKKYEKAILKGVVENPANIHYVRRNIMTNGAVVETDKGKARITSRPGQEGAINAVLVK